MKNTVTFFISAVAVTSFCADKIVVKKRNERIRKYLYIIERFVWFTARIKIGSN
jgi:hypothetical protein